MDFMVALVGFIFLYWYSQFSFYVATSRYKIEFAFQSRCDSQESRLRCDNVTICLFFAVSRAIIRQGAKRLIVNFNLGIRF